MSNIIAPPPDALPTRQQLRRYTIIALVAAIALTVLVVLPAERGIDPTGVGSLIGLTPMGEFKVAAAEELANERAEELRAAEDTARAEPAAPAHR